MIVESQIDNSVRRHAAPAVTAPFRTIPCPAPSKGSGSRSAVLGQAIERIQAIPGVESAALVRAIPFSGNGETRTYSIEGRPETAKGSEPRVGMNVITPDYFKTMGIPLMRGPVFTDRDDLGAPDVIIINATMARSAFGGDDPIGKRIQLKGRNDWLTIVGVAGDVKHGRLEEEIGAQAYTPHYQDGRIFASLVARTSGDPMALANPVRKAIWSVDKDQPVWKVMPMDRLIERAKGASRFVMTLLTAFALVAVLLAGVGIYGVMSYSVAQRTHEIGVRMALGASASDVVTEILRRGLALTGIALTIGLAAAVALSRLMLSLLFGVGPTDPATLAAAAVFLGCVALAACYLPARRAAHVDPVVALIGE